MRVGRRSNSHRPSILAVSSYDHIGRSADFPHPSQLWPRPTSASRWSSRPKRIQLNQRTIRWISIRHRLELTLSMSGEVNGATDVRIPRRLKLIRNDGTVSRDEPGLESEVVRQLSAAVKSGGFV